MGWSYRKSVNLGPFRVNISKSGIGYSLGGAGFRTGVSSGGHRRPRRLCADERRWCREGKLPQPGWWPETWPCRTWLSIGE